MVMALVLLCFMPIIVIIVVVLLVRNNNAAKCYGAEMSRITVWRSQILLK